MWKSTDSKDWTHIEYTLPDENFDPVTYRVSEQELIESEEYSLWLYAMVRAGKQDKISYAAFFEDFRVVHWGTYVKEI